MAGRVVAARLGRTPGRYPEAAGGRHGELRPARVRDRSQAAGVRAGDRQGRSPGGRSAGGSHSPEPGHRLLRRLAGQGRGAARVHRGGHHRSQDRARRGLQDARHVHVARDRARRHGRRGRRRGRQGPAAQGRSRQAAWRSGVARGGGGGLLHHLRPEAPPGRERAAQRAAAHRGVAGWRHPGAASLGVLSRGPRCGVPGAGAQPGP